MPSAFVPFLKPAATMPGATARKADSAPASGAFAAIVPGATNGPATIPTAGGCAHSNNGLNAKPKVTLQKDGDRVTHIHIQCGCGEVIELECAY